MHLLGSLYRNSRVLTVILIVDITAEMNMRLVKNYYFSVIPKQRSHNELNGRFPSIADILSTIFWNLWAKFSWCWTVKWRVVDIECQSMFLSFAQIWVQHSKWFEVGASIRAIFDFPHTHSLGNTSTSTFLTFSNVF